MRRARTLHLQQLVLILLLAFLLIPGTVGAERPVPDVTAEGIPPVLFAQLPFRTPDYPMFVSASAAISDDGEINAALFSGQAVRSLSRFLKRVDPLHDCIVLEEFYDAVVDAPDRSTVDKAARTAEFILIAEVVGRDFGFQHSTPGQLLEVKPYRALKGSAALENYYIFLPVGTFQAGPYRFCKSDYRYPDVPSTGERVLLMIPMIASLREPFLDLRTEASIIAIDSDGAIDLPQPFRDDHADDQLRDLSVEVLAQRISSALAAEEEGP